MLFELCEEKSFAVVVSCISVVFDCIFVCTLVSKSLLVLSVKSDVTLSVIPTVVMLVRDCVAVVVIFVFFFTAKIVKCY